MYCLFNTVGYGHECWFHRWFDYGIIGSVWLTIRWPFISIWHLVKHGQVYAPPLYYQIRVWLSPKIASLDELFEDVKANMIDVPPKYSKLINDNFWDLL